MEALLARDPSLKETAQRAFVSYIKSVFLMKNKAVFDVNALDTEAYSKSLGLAIPPRVRFLQRMNAKMAAAPKQMAVASTQSSNNRTVFEDSADENAEVNLGRSERNFELPESDSDDDDILTVKRKDHEIEAASDVDDIVDVTRGKKATKALTKAALAKKLMKKRILPNKKIVFDEEGEAVVQATREKRSEKAKEYESKDEGGINLEEAKEVLREEDKYDKQLFREKVKAKHREQKRKLKEMKRRKDDESDEEELESGDAPDLSWLPDPDRIYGKETTVEDAEVVDEESKKQRFAKFIHLFGIARFKLHNKSNVCILIKLILIMMC